MDWIGDMHQCFDHNQVENSKHVKFACTKLRGHASRGWEDLYCNRQKEGRTQSNKWDKMVVE